MRTRPRHRFLAFTCLGLLALTASLWILHHSRRAQKSATGGLPPERRNSVTQIAAPGASGVPPKLTDGRKSTAPSEAALTGEAAKEQLPKSGEFESLGAALQAARYAVEKIDPAGPHSRGAEYFGANPGQQLRAWFHPDGVELASGRSTKERTEPWSLSVRFKAAGRTGALAEVNESGIRAEGNRVEMIDYAVGVTQSASVPEGSRVEMTDPVASIIQWFENREDGIEQGFTLTERPAGEAPEVALVLSVEGTLRTEPRDEKNVCFVDAAGSEVLHYRGLKAWDAAGRELPARMEVRESKLALLVSDTDAIYPVTVDPLFANVEARLVSESEAGDQFGSAVALSPNTVLIGAPGDDTASGIDAGSVYVFVGSSILAGGYSFQAKLTAGDGNASDGFGAAVAISGDLALVGAPQKNTRSAIDAGSAYLFVRSGTAWTQQPPLAPPTVLGDFHDHFGWSVALSNDTALIGEPSDGTYVLTSPGKVHFFARVGTAWQFEQTKTALDGQAGGEFGCSVALENNTALVGARRISPEGGAYVFTRSAPGSAWSQQGGALKPNDSAFNALFGESVAVSGNTALIGCPFYSTTTGQTAVGSAYVFVRSGSTWTRQGPRLTANPMSSFHLFGASVALSNNTALIGSPTQLAVGSAHVFVRNQQAQTWSLQSRFVGTETTYDRFGAAVALSGETKALVGIPLADTAGGADAGKVTAFERPSASIINWTPQNVAASDGPAEDSLGSSVALSGDTVIVGAPNDGISNRGVAYVFVRSGALWIQQAKLFGESGLGFGTSIALSGNTAVIGAPAGDFLAGSAFVFERNPTGWIRKMLLRSDMSEEDRFGASVAVSNDTILVGSPDNNTPAGNGAGSAYVFVRNGPDWPQQARLLANDGELTDGFGSAVALLGDSALVGAPGDSEPQEFNIGSAYVFVRSGTTWGIPVKLLASDGAAHDEFGRAVALSADKLAIGAPGSGLGGGVYVFAREVADWRPEAKLTTSAPVAARGFGSAVALAGNTAIVGSPNDYSPVGLDVGSAYVFVFGGENWSQQVKLSAGPDASEDDEFGQAVAISGNSVIVGSAFDSTNGPGAGSAYVFFLGELPRLTQQPASRTVVLGKPVTFMVVATGYAPLRYQWRKNGFDITGATGSSYSVPSASEAHQGSYDVVISNIGGTVTSAIAVLTVNALSQFERDFPDTPPPEAEGFVLVTLSPPDIGGGWRFVGEQQWRASGVPAGGLTTGDRVIEFRPVPGFVQPELEPVGVVSGEPATLINALYEATVSTGSGELRVTLKPDSIADVVSVPAATRAQWRLLGESDGQWRDTGPGGTLTGLVPGSYFVECKPVAGRTTPRPGTVLVEDGLTSTPTVTYFLAEPFPGTPVAPAVLPFETVTTAENLPYAHVGQLRSSVGSGTGFVVKQRVVATAGHVVFDDGTLSAATGLQWLFQRDRGTYEPAPQIPRGFYLMTGYAEQRALENTPGTSLPDSQDLDVAALYFPGDAGRGGFSGFLASDAAENEFLLSSALKTLVGYPTEGIAAGSQGRMHATPLADVTFELARPLGRTYTTTDLSSVGGNSGGPLCIQFEGGNYYPAAIYLGGSGQTVVRAIDSSVIDLFNRADASSTGGGNNTDGGLSLPTLTPFGSSNLGAVQVTLVPAPAGAGWRLSQDSSPGDPDENTLRSSGSRVTGKTPGLYTLRFTRVAGFIDPIEPKITITGGRLTTVTFTYAKILTSLESWRKTHFNVTTNTGIAADTADPDYDGLVNLTEFAFALNPKQAKGGQLPQWQKIGQSYVLSFVQPAGTSGVTYIVEQSGSLGGGSWNQIANTGVAPQHAYTVPVSALTKIFLRIRVTSP